MFARTMQARATNLSAIYDEKSANTRLRINTVFFAGPLFLYSLSFHLYLRISGLCFVQMSPTALPKRSVAAK